MVPCNLLVPKADKGDMPLIIIAGSAMSPPPPAKVSMNPAKKAAANKNDNNSMVNPVISNSFLAWCSCDQY